MVLRIRRMPNFARACGRVLVGGHAGETSHSRLRSGVRLRGMDIPSRRNSRIGHRASGCRFEPRHKPAAGGETGEPHPPWGTQLKATTERAFLVFCCLLQRGGAGNRRGLSILPGVRRFSFKQWQSLDWREAGPLASPQCRGPTTRPSAHLFALVRACTGMGVCYDRPYPRIPSLAT